MPSASAMPTILMLSMERAFTSSLLMWGLCSAMTSSSWKPMRNTGFSEVIGSWKIMETMLPRTFCMASMGILATS